MVEAGALFLVAIGTAAIVLCVGIGVGTVGIVPMLCICGC